MIDVVCKGVSVESLFRLMGGATHAGRQGERHVSCEWARSGPLNQELAYRQSGNCARLGRAEPAELRSVERRQLQHAHLLRAAHVELEPMVGGRIGDHHHLRRELAHVARVHRRRLRLARERVGDDTHGKRAEDIAQMVAEEPVRAEHCVLHRAGHLR